MSVLEFNQMLVPNSNYLQPFAISLTRDQEVAKDLLQETLYRAWANREKYNAGTNIQAWLYTIMRNTFINSYRRKNKHKALVSTLQIVRDTVVSNPAESNLRMKDIQEAMHNLPDLFRIPFLLYLDGYKYQEIADQLNEPLGTIKSRIHFARKVLKAQCTPTES